MSTTGDTLTARGPLAGRARVPGDKSVGHRALMLGALCDGVVEITGLSDGEDNLSTARVLGQLGVRSERDGDRARVHGVGLDGLRAPTGPLDCGNSGTTMRVLLGILAGQPFEVTLVGDHSLTRRPMRRVLEPLTRMGLTVVAARDGGFPPLTVRGARPLTGLVYASPIASAQVKSAILLAGLWAEGETRVDEPGLSRDHTERMLAWLGTPPAARPIHVPGDLSSAAFLLGAALLVPGSDVVIEDVGVNPTRTGFLDIVAAMGATVVQGAPRERNHEPAADLGVRCSGLRGVEVAGDLALRALDELPLVATLAARARGVTRIRDAKELRVKESDRIAQTARMLRSFGVAVDEHEDGLTIHGDPDRPLTAGDVDADGDHRIAMCANLLALVAPAGTRIAGAESIATSFPSFHACLRALGAADAL
ncbi:MAG: 3-phosphoshikimate 1-carboxyvinyltransferase [Deltaproteobacteria bacterium HGW-Deltaproteobacteria-14]|jgi:3-phosphoshikimate 1-carboxyvinyltransferase|nr:MAG: 3-phosphoshikimate 1-carboxyvinyltransferase [Deltaproteobacteria bacterium HGW-Deltaproteobacteria-14]